MLSVRKPKLPKGKAYALKTSLLQAALTPDRLPCDVSLDYWTPQSESSVLWAEYWLPNARRAAMLYVRAGSLATEDARVARSQLADCVLPRFAEWVHSILALPADASALHPAPRFEAIYVAGALSVEVAPP